MPQFAPGATKTAIAPIVAKPSGMDCEAELFLGPDELTKVATSGRVPFVSTGAAKNVSLPITMPSEPGTFKGYIDVFTEDIRFLSYILKEDVIIEELTLPVNGGIVLNINGRKFSEIGIGADGLPYGVLSSPVEAADIRWAITISLLNESVMLDEDNLVKMYFNLWLEPAWDAVFPYNSPPALRAWCSNPLKCETPEKGCPPGVRLLKPPFETTGSFAEVFGGGYWKPGVYNGRIHWCARYFDQYQGPCFGAFRIKNLLQMTTTGEYA